MKINENPCKSLYLEGNSQPGVLGNRVGNAMRPGSLHLVRWQFNQMEIDRMPAPFTLLLGKQRKPRSLHPVVWATKQEVKGGSALFTPTSWEV